MSELLYLHQTFTNCVSNQYTHTYMSTSSTLASTFDIINKPIGSSDNSIPKQNNNRVAIKNTHLFTFRVKHSQLGMIE